MTNREFVSRVSNQLHLLGKDDYRSDRYVVSVGRTISEKFITQKIQRRSIDRDMSLYREITCIEFEPVNIFECKYVEFKSCKKLSKSVKKFSDLTFTRYGSSIKELYSIDRNSAIFTESTLYQIRLNSDREGGEAVDTNRFYILDGYIYIPEEVDTLSGMVLMMDQYELDELCGCNDDDCESFWEKEFVASDNSLEDVINYTVQNVLQSKQVPEDNKNNMNNNEK